MLSGGGKPATEQALVAGSEKAAAHRLGLSHSTVKHHLANARSKVSAVSGALATYEIPIEGRDEWVAAARRLA